MKVLVIGSGGREHAICWKLAQSSLVTKLYAAPGNPGMLENAKLVDIKLENITALRDFARNEAIDLTVVGPELPLSLGIVDSFREAGLRIFGPSQAAAQLESSKLFAKSVMQRAGVRTAAHQHVSDLASARTVLQKFGAPLVLKADGLAAGKGVIVCQDLKQAEAALQTLFEKYAQGGILIEQFIKGVEASFIVATDGRRVAVLSNAHDYKRVFDKDQGPNTGGMGSVSPTPRLQAAQEQVIVESIIRPVLHQMERDGCPFQGFLYAGLMIEPSGEISVIEFNARLGDPETQAILRRLSSDLFELIYTLSDPQSQPESLMKLDWSPLPSVCIVLAAKGYPEQPLNGAEIRDLEQAKSLEGVQIFHAGTKLDQAGKLISAGGRVLSVTAVGDTINQARQRAYRACSAIKMQHGHFRTDIGLD